MKKIHYLILSFIVVIGLVGTGLRTNIIKLPIVKKTISPISLLDTRDDRNVVGAAENVFIGKVIKQTGTGKDKFGFLYTQFEVEVIDNIKGNLSGKVTVEQSAGYINGVLYTVEDGGDGYFEPTGERSGFSLLKSGATYLLVTGYNTDTLNYYLFTSAKSRTFITDDKKLDNLKLKEFANSNEAVKRLRAIYPDEILFAPFVSAGNTKNSFMSLPPEEQEKLKAEAEKYKKELNIPDYEPTPARQNIIPEVLQQDIDAHPESQLPQAVQ
jgi:hypothetical protein